MTATIKGRAGRVYARAALAAACVCGLAACRSVSIDKHDPVVVQVASNQWLVAEGGWEAHYFSYGTLTQLGQLNICIDSNKAVRVKLDDYNGDLSTNHIYIITASGEAAGEAIKKAIEGLKR